MSPSRNNPTKRLLFGFLGLTISIIPVTVAIFSYFPLWIDRDDTSLLSGISFILLCTALIPMYKHFKRIMRSPSVPLMWLIIFVLFFMLSRIADEMTVISFVGFISNLVGSLFFKLARNNMSGGRNEGGS